VVETVVQGMDEGWAFPPQHRSAGHVAELAHDGARRRLTTNLAQLFLNKAPAACAAHLYQIPAGMGWNTPFAPTDLLGSAARPWPPAGRIASALFTCRRWRPWPMTPGDPCALRPAGSGPGNDAPVSSMRGALGPPLPCCADPLVGSEPRLVEELLFSVALLPTSAEGEGLAGTLAGLP